MYCTCIETYHFTINAWHMYCKCIKDLVVGCFFPTFGVVGYLFQYTTTTTTTSWITLNPNYCYIILESNYSSCCTGGSSENDVCSSSGGDIRGKKKRKEGDETQFTTTRIGGKTSLGPSYFAVIKTIRSGHGGCTQHECCQNFIPSYAFDALLWRNWPFSQPPLIA